MSGEYKDNLCLPIKIPRWGDQKKKIPISVHEVYYNSSTCSYCKYTDTYRTKEKRNGRYFMSWKCINCNQTKHIEEILR